MSEARQRWIVSMYSCLQSINHVAEKTLVSSTFENISVLILSENPSQKKTPNLFTFLPIL